MPHRHYVASEEPPTLWDRVLAHPFVASLGTMSVFLGTWVIVGVFTGVVVFRALEETPPIVRVVAGIPLVVGGLVSVHSIGRPSDRKRRLKDMETERFGSTILAFAWFAYAGAIALGGLDRVPPGALISLAVSMSFALNVWALRVSEKRIEQRVYKDRKQGGS